MSRSGSFPTSSSSRWRRRCRPAPAAAARRCRTCRPGRSRDYGNRVGVFRLMEVLDRHGIRAHRRAQQRPVRAPSGDHRRRQQARLGMDGPQREQHAPAQRGAARRRGRHHPAHARDHREGDRHAAGRLARLRPAGDLEHARSAGRRRLRICLRLDATTTSPT